MIIMVFFYLQLKVANFLSKPIKVQIKPAFPREQ